MNNQKSLLLLLFSILGVFGFSQENEDYVEFNDRNNVVHGVYLGITLGYGEIDSEDTYLGGLKIAYVANQQFEVGFAGTFFFSDQSILRSAFRTEELIGVYGGLHLEPILFSKSKVNLSFPLLIGGGALGYINSNEIEENGDVLSEDDVDVVFVAEPGVSALFNINRYLQIEAGIKYRLSSKIELLDSPVTRINGFSGGIGIKIGVFNLGRNRYKKNIDDGE